ncbi:C6 transcription factor [Westerdykella ornata]|uniref:C6 transcription factor n=1 Tax=Westerdykella ornata TaxID=318751 RepID=A0A6A6JH81_WESOR|nr:C6 transcription factor [Westerdykella ornata]KAF2275727.1 C6 transcription factor [Westerdykella ornata]
MKVRDFDNEGSSDDELQHGALKKVWDETIKSDDLLLFRWPHSTVALYTLHPQPLDIFRLWQIYLDNVNPLLKVTHTPTLQARILSAAGDIINIAPELEALMFSIYSMAIFSLSEESCYGIFASSKSSLLAAYQMGCQQALVNCNFLRTTSRDCLTALYLYLISIRDKATPQSLSSMLSAAIRIAQRIGIHNESTLSKVAPLEAEMCRRLWWCLVIFDARIGEMADIRATSLLPIWDCKLPLNVNDSDLREDMKEHPQMQGIWTEALFAVVRSELGDALRTARHHLGTYAPSLNIGYTGNPVTEVGQTHLIERHFEEKYLGRCDSGNPLHFMTIWFTRGLIAKLRLMEHHFQYSGSPLHQAEGQRAAAVSYALTMLKANTMLVTSPLTQGFRWMVNQYFPLIAYIQTLQYVKSHPSTPKAAEGWIIMSENHQAHGNIFQMPPGLGFYKILANLVLQAWDAHAASTYGNSPSAEAPPIVVSMRQRMAAMAKQRMLSSEAVDGNEGPARTDLGTDFSASTATDPGFHQNFNNSAPNDGYMLQEWASYADLVDLQPENLPAASYV